VSSAAADLLRALDPVEFAGACGIAPDPWQEAVLRSAARQTLLCCGRQTGKSTVCALVALHELVYRPGALVLLAAPTLRQSGELFRKLIAFWRAAGRPVEPERRTTFAMELRGGSRVLALPGEEDTVRGFASVDLVVVDEAARVDEDLMAAVRPMLAVSGGRLLAASTPAGRRGWFYEAWEHGGPGWERHRVPSSACPRIDPEFLRLERRALGAALYAQEYEARFVDETGMAFSGALVERAFDDNEEVWAI